MTSAISKQVSEFKSDTIQATSENSALATNIFIFSPFFYFSILQNTRAHPQLLCWLSRFFQEKQSVKQKKKNIFFLHLAPQKRLSHKFQTKKKQRRSGQAPGYTYRSRAATTMGRGHMVCTHQTILSTTCVSVCDSFSLSLLPHIWPPCQPPPPTRAAQLRCDLWTRPKWALWCCTKQR